MIEATVYREEEFLMKRFYVWHSLEDIMERIEGYVQDEGFNLDHELFIRVRFVPYEKFI